jgi:hypothetical protein
MPGGIVQGGLGRKMAPSVPPDPDLHERSLRHPFGDVTVGLVRRRGGYIPAAGGGFIRLVRHELGTGQDSAPG